MNPKPTLMLMHMMASLETAPKVSASVRHWEDERELCLEHRVSQSPSNGFERKGSRKKHCDAILRPRGCGQSQLVAEARTPAGLALSDGNGMVERCEE